MREESRRHTKTQEPRKSRDPQNASSADTGAAEDSRKASEASGLSRRSDARKNLPMSEVFLMVIIGIRVLIPYVLVILVTAAAGYGLFALLFL